MRAKIATMREKLARNPKAYDKEIIGILSNKYCDPWTKEQKTNFIDTLKIIGKDYKAIFSSNRVHGKTYL